MYRTFENFLECLINNKLKCIYALSILSFKSPRFFRIQNCILARMSKKYLSNFVKLMGIFFCENISKYTLSIRIVK